MDMFSGFTTQVSSWMGAKKQEGAEGPPKSEEENVTPTVQDAGEGSLATVENKKESPTKGSSRLEMFANVKSQMTSWLGGSNVASGDQVPAEEGISAEAKEDVKTEPVGSEKSPADVKEDDDSSATGGADSDAAPSEGSPGEEKDATSGFGAAAVSTKAIQGAKSIGSFLFSAVNKAGKTVSEAGAKIKKTVEENSILGEFNREQEAFIKEKQQAGEKIDGTTPAPWVGYPNEEALKEQILSLSTDRRNFVRSPPAGVEFQFDLESFMPVAQATLAQDPNLQQMRFELVPKVISEDNFWRNYFYRVGLIRQSSELTSMAEESSMSAGATESGPDGTEKCSLDVGNVIRNPTSSHSPEFVSDAIPRPAPHDLEEVRQGVEKLGVGSMSRNGQQEKSADGTQDTESEEKWERELQAELQEFEIVESNQHKSYDQRDVEDEVQELLDAQDEDFK